MFSYYTRTLFNAELAVHASHRQQNEVITDDNSPDEEGYKYTSGFLCVSRRHDYRLDPNSTRNSHWRLVDDEGSVKTWRSKDVSNLFLKESWLTINGCLYEVSSIYSRWDVVSGRVRPLTELFSFTSLNIPCAEVPVVEVIHDQIRVCRSKLPRKHS